MIFTGIRELCVMSVICGAAISIAPEGMVKQMTQILCACVLLTVLLSTVREFRFYDFALQTAKLRAAEAEILQSAEDAEHRLNRTVIEQDLRTYILDKAASAGIDLHEVSFGMRWDMEGYWVPESVSLWLCSDEAGKRYLSDILKYDFGIPADMQEYIDV